MRKSEYRIPKTRGLGDLIRPSLKKAQQKRGFGEDAILRNWADIVGEELASYCVPQKLSLTSQQRSLSVWCDPARATELHYQQELICEKIATFVGYRAVEKLIIRQQVLNLPEEEEEELRPLTAEEEAEVRRMTAKIEDDDIRARLEALARLRFQLFSE
jgi:hypothetical protein